MIAAQRLVEKVFCVLALLLYTGGIAPFISPSNPLYPVKENFPNLAFAIALLLIAARWQRVFKFVVREKFLWMFLGVIVLSPLWSDLPQTTIQEVLPLMRVTVFAIYFSTRYRMSEQMQILTWVLGLAALFSLILAIALPNFGVMGRGYLSNAEDLAHPGAWRGIYIHKVVLGTLMSCSALAFFYYVNSGRKFCRSSQIGIVLSVVVLLGSTTKAALGVLLVVLLMLPLYRMLRWNYTRLLPALIVTSLLVGGFATIIAGSLDTVLSAFGKDVTISGRTEIWPLILERIWQRPWLGYGYSTFWAGGWDGEPASIWIYLSRGFEPPHAHNDFLDLLLSVGYVGFCLFLLSFFSVCVRAIAWLRTVKTTEGFVPIAYLTFVLLSNLTESLFVKPTFYWVFYVSITLSMYEKVPLYSLGTRTQAIDEEEEKELLTKSF